MAVDLAEATEAAMEAVVMVAARVVVVMVAAGTVRVLHCTSTVDDLARVGSCGPDTLLSRHPAWGGGTGHLVKPVCSRIRRWAVVVLRK